MASRSKRARHVHAQRAGHRDGHPQQDHRRKRQGVVRDDDPEERHDRAGLAAVLVKTDEFGSVDDRAVITIVK